MVAGMQIVKGIALFSLVIVIILEIDIGCSFAATNELQPTATPVWRVHPAPTLPSPTDFLLVPESQESGQAEAGTALVGNKADDPHGSSLLDKSVINRIGFLHLAANTQLFLDAATIPNLATDGCLFIDSVAGAGGVCGVNINSKSVINGDNVRAIQVCFSQAEVPLVSPSCNNGISIKAKDLVGLNDPDTKMHSCIAAMQGHPDATAGLMIGFFAQNGPLTGKYSRRSAFEAGFGWDYLLYAFDSNAKIGCAGPSIPFQTQGKFHKQQSSAIGFVTIESISVYPPFIGLHQDGLSGRAYSGSELGYVELFESNDRLRIGLQLPETWIDTNQADSLNLEFEVEPATLPHPVIKVTIFRQGQITPIIDDTLNTALLNEKGWCRLNLYSDGIGAHSQLESGDNLLIELKQDSFTDVDDVIIYSLRLTWTAGIQCAV